MPDPAYEEAKAKVARLRGFYSHLATYLLVMCGLFVIDMLTRGGPWFFWPLAGWGIGIAAHAWSTFVEPSRFGAEWENRKIQEYMREKQ